MSGPVLMLRKSHRKVRSGCATCKRRRIKCGEEKPQCWNCRVHNASCVYEAIASRPAREPEPEPELEPALQLQEPSTFTHAHMELLHHYTVSTALTLSSNAQVREVWQDRVPRLALHTDYVLHALLAVSALHLARLRPSAGHSYWTMGVQLYQTALGQAKTAMEHISEQNCTELYLFSTLTCFFSLAKNREFVAQSLPREEEFDEEEDLLSWVFLFRGTKMLLMPAYEKPLHNGPLAPMFEQGAERVRMLQAHSTADAMFVDDKLREIVRGHICETSESEVYVYVVRELRRCFHAVYGQPLGNIETMDVFVWFFRVSDEYIDRLKRYEQPALAIFICFSHLVQQLEGIWWAEGWGSWILSRLRNQLHDRECAFADRLMEILASS